MKNILSIKELLSIEESLEVLSFCFEYDNILMWPFVRSFLLQGAVNKMFGFANPHASKEKKTYKDIVSYLVNTVKGSPFSKNKNAHNDILIFSSGIVNVKREDGRYFNRLYDYLAFEYENNTLIIEDSIRRKYRRPRVFPNVKYHDLILIKIVLKTRYKKPSIKDIENIERFICFLKREFLYKLEDEVWNEAKRVLKIISKKLPVAHFYYSKLFKKLSPKIVILEGGSYGCHSYILKWAKEMGLVTGELQHGNEIFIRNHQAHIYNNKIFGSEYEKYLPDYLLTFGRYCDNNVSTPCKIVPVGNPYIIEYLKSYVKLKRNETKKLVLFISSGIIPGISMGVVLGLKKKLDNSKFEIIFRPHPGEIPFIEDRYNDLKENGILFDYDNLYDTLSTVDFIIATTPDTVLFEAMLFKKRIFVLNHPYVSYYIDPHIFNAFEDLEELAELISNNQHEDKDYNSSCFWEENWRDNYRNFIENIVGIRN